MNDVHMSIIWVLALLPFAHWNGTFSPYEIPKTWIISLVASVSAVCFFYKNKRNNEIERPSNILYAVLLLWGWLIISAFINGYWPQSWKGNYYRNDGLWTLASMVVIGLINRPSKTMLRAMGWSSLILSAMTIISLGKSAIYMGNVNFLAGYLAITLPFTQLVGIWAVGFQLLAILSLGSWGGILTGLIYILIWAIYKNKKILPALLIVIIMATGIIYVQNQIRINPEGLVLAEGRVRIWRKAVIAIREKPMTGWGWAQFGRAFKQIDWPVHYDTDANVDRTHSILTEYAAAGGIPALTLFIFIAFSSIKILLIKGVNIQKSIGFMMILYMFQSQTNVTSVAQDWLFYLGVGEAIRIQQEG